MYEEGSRRIGFNWISIAIKLVILAVFVFLLCWIFTKLTNNDNKVVENNSEYINNITAMKEAAFEYFTESKLPEKVGDTEKLSLSQMLDQKLLIDFTDNGDKCNTSSSYVQTTKTADGAYALKVSLDCGEKNDFIVTTIEKTKCVVENNCEVAKDDVDKTTTNNNNSNTNNTSSNNVNTNTNKTSNSNKTTSSSSTANKATSTTNKNNYTSTNTSSSNSSSKVTTSVKTTVKVTVSCKTCSTTNNNVNNTNNNVNNNTNNNTNNNNSNENTNNNVTKPEETKKLYYKLVKYSDWKDGYSNAKNAENEKYTVKTYNYCKEYEDTIYSTSYLKTTSNKTNYSYTIKLLKIKTDNVKDNEVNVSNRSYFSSSLNDYNSYLNQVGKNVIHMVGNDGTGNSNMLNASQFRLTSLKSNNFTFSVSDAYKSGSDYYVNVNVNVNERASVASYYDASLGFSLHYLPLKFDISYVDADNCIRDTYENRSKYSNYDRSDLKTETYWKHRTYEYKWSTEKVLSGWDYTGESEYR